MVSRLGDKDISVVFFPVGEETFEIDSSRYDNKYGEFQAIDQLGIARRNKIADQPPKAPCVQDAPTKRFHFTFSSKPREAQPGSDAWLKAQWEKTVADYQASKQTIWKTEDAHDMHAKSETDNDASATPCKPGT